MATGGNVEVVWTNLMSYLTPESSQVLGTSNSLQQFRQNPVVFARLREWFLEKCQKDLKDEFRPQFWSNVQHSEVKGKGFNTLLNAVSNLHRSLSAYKPYVELLQSLSGALPLRNLNLQFEGLVKAVIFCDIPEQFKCMVHAFYSQSFQAYQSINRKESGKMDTSGTSSISIEDEDEGEDDDVESLTCVGCAEEKDCCHCAKIIDGFSQLNSQLRSLGLMKKVAEPAFLSVIHSEIQRRIEEKCKGEFESSFLTSLLHWIDTELSGWLLLIFQIQGGNATSDSSTTSAVSQDDWKPKLQYFMYKSFADLRISELFTIIVEYPDSLPAIQDLKECLEVTDQRKELIVSLRSAFERRLLHPGANTSDILTQYVSAIRALHVLDPAGVILEHVCTPVRQYLRTREDTVRCIVTSLTDENSTELAEELMRGDPRTIDDQGACDSEGDDDENWMPAPSDADPDKISSSRKAPDIISMLVNIYGSKDLFVSEYRTLLADRVLSSFNYDTEKELRYLELLKLRFGESHLHFCEIMLKDVADSRRINSHIQASAAKSENTKTQSDIPLTAMVLSAVFWPAFREEKLKVAEEVQRAMDEYTRGFEALKGMRTLRWKPHLGLVEVEVELADRTLSLSVTPAQATAIMHFQEKERWTLEELSGVMHVPPGLLRRRLGFWISQGVLKEESTDTFTVVEKQKGQQRVPEVVMDAEVESVMASSQDQREEELQVFWSYIVGMLTNLESLPLDRIHSMLRMFAMQDSSSSQCSVDDLRRFLDRKVKDQELQFVNGFYRLPKSGR